MTEYPDLTGTRLGNYRLVRMLGRGRMGVVYLAQDEALLRPTAVKLLSWAFLESHGDRPEAWFLAEARSVARINHPAVVQVYNVAKHGNYCYIAMEYVEGVSGDALVANDGPLSPIDATQVVLQIAGALNQAHSCNIIHRDVKPANVLIKSDRTAKLGDFGMALQTTSSNRGTSAPIGTPHYIVPEIWQGAAATPLTDIYALGATYFFLLTGKPPYDTSDLRTLINAHVQSAIPDPHSLVAAVPPECSSILQKCLAKLPADRYASAQDLSWDLRGMLRSVDGRTPAPVMSVAEKRRVLRATKSEEAASSAPKIVEPWMAAMGFARPPFGAVDSRTSPYQGEPLRSAHEQLSAFVRTEHGRTIVLTGARGSGRTVLARQTQAEVSENTPVSYLDLKWGEQQLKAGRTLPKWACSALGASPSTSSSSDAYLEGLIEHLAESPQPAVLVLDSVPDDTSLVDKLAVLVRAAYSTRCMTLIIVGNTTLPGQLVSVGKVDAKAISSLTLRPLDAIETAAYIAAWLKSAKSETALPMIVTTDAAMVVCHRAGGNLVRINTLASNMLRMAALDKRRVIPSWYAWTASEEQDWRPDGSADLRKPAGWPPQEVLAILNSCREKCGIPQRREPEGQG